MAELFQLMEQRNIVHTNFGPESAIAQAGPIADLAIPDVCHIEEPVAAYIGEINELRFIGLHQLVNQLYLILKGVTFANHQQRVS